MFYIICETVNKHQFVTNFVVCIVLLAMDFWTVKNVTGRLLVGMRWWNDASESGSAWRFESLPEGARVINPHESRWFWIVLCAAPVLWALSALTALFGFDWGERGGGFSCVCRLERRGRSIGQQQQWRLSPCVRVSPPPPPQPRRRSHTRTPTHATTNNKQTKTNNQSVPAHPDHGRRAGEQQPDRLLQVQQGREEAAAGDGRQLCRLGGGQRDAVALPGGDRARLMMHRSYYFFCLLNISFFDCCERPKPSRVTLVFAFSTPVFDPSAKRARHLQKPARSTPFEW